MAKILLFEDDHLIADIYKTLFEARGAELLHHLDGIGCVDITRDFGPDLVVSDILMPHKSGLDVLAELKSDPTTSHIEVVMLTNVNDPTTRDEAHRRGAAHYLVKMESSPMETVDTILSLLE